MDLNSVLNEVILVFKEVLDTEDIELKYETTANDVEDWDSLTHIQIIVAVEKHFKIRFNSGEIQKFKNVGEMCDAILKKIQDPGME
jgi:acyl carrier protein